MTKVPFAGATTAANPTEHSNTGTRGSLLTDGAGILLALVVDGANRHDAHLLRATLDSLAINRLEPTFEQNMTPCLYTKICWRGAIITMCAVKKEPGERSDPWLMSAVTALFAVQICLCVLLI